MTALWMSDAALLLEMLRLHGRQTPEQLAFDHI